MCAPSVPAPPDPKDTAAASTGTNVDTAIANAWLGNINEITPEATTKVDQTGDYTWTNDYTGESYTVPTFTRTTEYSPQQQAILNQSNAAKLNLSSLANDQSAFLGKYLSEPFQYDSGAHEKWSLNLYDSLNNEKVAQGDEALRSRLANQGIAQGSEAYDREMENYYDSTGNQRNNFLLNSYNTGFSTAQAQRNQPINEITALLSGSQVSQPNFMGADMPTIPTTDVAGIINENYNQQLSAYQMAQAQRNSVLGGLFGLGGSLLSLSDERAKENIEKVGKLKGHTLYEYEYKGDPSNTKHIGVMAQSVKKSRPDAVHEGKDGLLRVDYGALFQAGM